MLEFRDMQRIEAIVAQGGFTRAARALGMTQPALTRSIAGVEARLRGPLFRRGRRGAEPTPLCRTILAEAPEILSRMQILNDRLGQMRGGSGEEVSIVSGPFPFDVVCLPAALALGRSQPRTRLRIEILPWPSALAQLRQRLAEVAVITANEAMDLGEFTVEPLPALPLHFIIRAGHPLLAARRLSFAAVLAYPLVTTAHLSTMLHTALAEARGSGPRADMPFPALLLESLPGWLRAVRGSDAVALAPPPAIAEELARGEVVALPLAAPWLVTSPAILRLASQPPGAAVEAVLAELREAARRAAQPAP